MTVTKKSEFIVEVVPMKPLSYKVLRDLCDTLKEQNRSLLKELTNKEKAVKGISKTVKKWRDACMEEKKKFIKVTVELNTLKRSMEEKKVLKRKKISEIMQDIKKEEAAGDKVKEDNNWMTR